MTGANPTFTFPTTTHSQRLHIDNLFALGSSSQPSLVSSSKQTQSELAEKIEDHRWEEHLRQLGQELREVRQARGMSLYQLHYQTLVPLYHLRALETGQLEKLPEPIYVRGFVRKIGNVLGLDGDRLAISLSATEPIKSSVLPSWQKPEYSSGVCVNNNFLYFGYAAFISLAVSGLAVISNQPTSRLSHDQGAGEYLGLSPQASPVHHP